MRKLFLHIGTHKTGSTSLQNYLFEHEDILHQNGLTLYRGLHRERNHIELYLASMRYDRDSFAKQKMTDIVFNEQYTNEVVKRVQNFVSSCSTSNIIFTTEGLSLLRHQDEIDGLLKIFDVNDFEITVILYLRNRDDYLNSYTQQLLKKKGRVPSGDYWSALYVEHDTWLIDYEQLISVYKRGFGEKRILVIDYDEEMKSFSNIIPSFLEVIGVNLKNQQDQSSYFFNSTLHKKSALREHVCNLFPNVSADPPFQ
jgi:hypothetical protein